MTFVFKDRWAVVTGASSGIGEAVARELAERGCHLYLVARRGALLERLADRLVEEHGIQARWTAMDLSAPGAAEELCNHVEAVPVSILVNNAGFAMGGPFQDLDWQRCSAMFDLNIKFLTEFTLQMLPALKNAATGARILNMGSITGYQGVPYMTAYAGTKGFVNNFSEGLNWELRGSGVVVTCVQPGETATEFFASAGMSETSIAKSSLMSSAAVAKIAVDAMGKGRVKVVPGWFNKIRIFGLRLSPRWLVRLVISRMFSDMAHSE